MYIEYGKVKVKLGSKSSEKIKQTKQILDIENNITNNLEKVYSHNVNFAHIKKNQVLL